MTFYLYIILVIILFYILFYFLYIFIKKFHIISLIQVSGFYGWILFMLSYPLNMGKVKNEKLTNK